ncbi:glycosyl transferase [Pandoraea horticolens]|uniref:Glycosyl transferase n=1 Tax=Pandoraea horticolens TaxID=2508298 RepID=A0A5E4ZC20_9BURK|nr:glycosyl transferase [Pandoraea horticolens]
MRDVVSPPYAVGSNPLRLHRQFSSALQLVQTLRDELFGLYRHDRPDLLIADFTLASVGLVADELGMAWWTSLPSPCVLESRDGPPAYMGGWLPKNGLAGKARDAAGRFCVRTFKSAVGLLYADTMRRVGLVSVYRADGTEAIYSRERILVLGMPELEFARSWPTATTMIGPMLYTPPPIASAPPFRPGKRHVLVTMGTHLNWCKGQIAAEVQRVAAAMPLIEIHFSDGRDAVQNVERDGNFTRLSFVDYDQFLCRYDLVVHHGGSGVLYYCLREGKRAVVYPVDYDQFDNAARLTFAGVACRIYRLDQLGAAIRQTLADEGMAARCTSFSTLLKTRDSKRILQSQVAMHFS